MSSRALGLKRMAPSPSVRAPACRVDPGQYTNQPDDHRPTPRGARRGEALDGERDLPRGAGRQDRAGRSQRRGQDHAHQDPRRRRPPRLRVRARHGLGRLPPAGPAHRRPRGAGARADPVGARPRRRRPPPAGGRGRDGQRRPGDAGARDAPLRAGRRRRCTPAAGTPPSRRPPRSPTASASTTGSSASRCGPCPVASAAGSSWPGSCSPAPRRCCSTSRPTTSTPTRSCWLREFLKAHKGGLVVISHDTGLLETTVNRVLHLDANAGRDRRLQHGVVGVPRPARDRRATPQARAAQRRAQGRRADGPGQQDAGQGDQGPGRAVDDEARRAADGRPRGRAPGRPGGAGSSSRRRRRAARRR